MDDLKIRLFRQDIINYINSVEIPIEIKRLVLAEVYSQVAQESEKVIEAQYSMKKGEEKNESSENV